MVNKLYFVYGFDLSCQGRDPTKNRIWFKDWGLLDWIEDVKVLHVINVYIYTLEYKFILSLEFAAHYSYIPFKKKTTVQTISMYLPCEYFWFQVPKQIDHQKENIEKHKS